MSERGEGFSDGDGSVRDVGAAYEVRAGERRREEVPPGYKRTELGVIPENWEVTTIGEVVSFSGGTQPPRSTFSFVPKDGYIRLIQIRDYKNDSFLTFVPETSNLKKCYKKDVMIGRYGPPIFQILRGLEGAYNVALIKTIPSKKIDVEYWYYIVSQEKLFNLIESLSRRSSGQTGVEMPALKRFGIPLPDLPEQRAIASALSDADDLIHSLDRLIAKKRAIKQAAMQQLLAGRVRLPGFHGSWKSSLLGDIGTFFKGQGIRRDQITDEGLPCIRYGEIYTRYENYTAKLFSRIPDEVAQTAGKICTGDLLFAGSGETSEEIGKCVAYLGEPLAYAGGDIVVCRPKGQNPNFLGQLLNHPAIVAQKARLGQGDAIVHISAGSLAKIEIQLPPDQEQKAIATVLSDMDAEIEKLERRRDKAQKIKQGMMQQLLTGRVRLV